MTGNLNSHSQIGRRLRLRDLNLFQEVLQRGSMSKAASHLGMSQPAVSEVIAGLEHELGVRLFDRNAQGVKATPYGHALFRRSLAAFDELKQGVRDIEFLSDPTTGELRVGAVLAPAATILPPIVHRFAEQYPNVVLRIEDVPAPSQELTGLHDRKYDLILGRGAMSLPEGASGETINVEFLLDDPHVIAAGMHTPWARRRKIGPAELMNERWIIGAPGTWNRRVLVEALQVHGLKIPKTSLESVSIHVRAHLLSNGPFISLMPKSLARHYGLQVLPVDLAIQPYPVVIFTLKHRTLTPVAQRFIDCAREIARTLAKI